jgi:hypothetical protein
MVRHARALVRWLAIGAVFVVAAVAGVGLHLGVPAVRRAVVARVDAALATAFAGRVTVEHLGRLTARSVDGVDVRVDDPEGRTVLVVEGVRAHVSLLGTLLSVVRGGAIAVDVADITAARADVDLDADESGTPRIARAVAPRTPSSPEKPGRAVRVALENVHVGHAHVHGQPSGSPPIDATIDDLRGALHFAPNDLAVDLAGASVETAVPGGAKAVGTLGGKLTMPSS